MARQQLRIYDDWSGIPQPQGAVDLGVPEDASDEVVREAIVREWADASREFVIGYRGGGVNVGWSITYTSPPQVS
jgi:hypothetical protein